MTIVIANLIHLRIKPLKFCDSKISYVLHEPNKWCRIKFKMLLLN